MKPKILLAADLGLHSSYILQYTVDLAAKLDAHIVVLHALEPMNELAHAVVKTFVDDRELNLNGRDKLHYVEKVIHERVIDLIADEMLDAGFDLSVVDDVKVVSGRAADVIVQQAELMDVDFIAVGNHGYHTQCYEDESDRLGLDRGHDQEGLGSVSERVLRRAKQPVFVIPVLDSLSLQEKDSSLRIKGYFPLPAEGSVTKSQNWRHLQ